MTLCIVTPTAIPHYFHLQYFHLQYLNQVEIEWGGGMEIIQFAHRECDGRQLVSVF